MSAKIPAIVLLWVTNIAGQPLFFSTSLTSTASFCERSSSRELNGSSNSRTDGLANSALAKATLCPSPQIGSRRLFFEILEVQLL